MSRLPCVQPNVVKIDAIRRAMPGGSACNAPSWARETPIPGWLMRGDKPARCGAPLGTVAGPRRGAAGNAGRTNKTSSGLFVWVRDLLPFFDRFRSRSLARRPLRNPI